MVPLPKIDEIYERLKGSMVLSEKSRPKSAFVSSFGKWEFKRCPFGLAQVPAHFQRLVNEVLLGLTFTFGYQIEEKEVKILHPITYMSGLFCGSQMNWACLTKEAYAIYMSIKKLTYYLEDADITLRSDHLPLKKFLVKNTLNSNVNNWAIEISPFHITFEYI